METNTPEELAQSGTELYQEGDYIASAEIFAAAAAGYKEKEDTLNAAEMANNQSVALVQAGENQAALDAATGTDEIFAQAGDAHRQALALGNIGTALDGLDRLEEAETAYQSSADMLKDLGEDQLRATVMSSISKIQLRSGRQLEAVVTMQAGIDGVDRPSLVQRILKKLLKVPIKFLNR